MRGALRRTREAAGLSQAELAARAGVSRALVAAAESGRNAPAVDAALRLAAALDVTVEHLFAPDRAVDLAGVPDGPVVAGRVGDRLVVHRAVVAEGDGGWPPADGVVAGGRLHLHEGAAPDGFVVAGCDPLLGLAARLAPARGARRIVPVHAPTGTALAELGAGRCHAALIHGPAGALPMPRPGVARHRIAAWRVGVAFGGGGRALADALAGRLPLVQREPAAASQAELERAATRLGIPLAAPTHVAGGHVEAARAARLLGAAGLTFEPAAIALGLPFAPVGDHVVELWIAADHRAHPGAAELLALVAGAPLRDRLGAIGGYDLVPAAA